MLLGACAGSTGGGIKMVRLALLFKAMARQVKQAIRPRSVATIKMDGRPVDEVTISRVLVFFFGYLLIILVAMLIVSVDNFSFETNLTAVLSAVSNIGPGLGAVGPRQFRRFFDPEQMVLSICMLVGRLEIYPILMLFAPSIWRKN